MSEGGSHMSGSYYTVDISKIVILDYFGGFDEVTVKEYLNIDTSTIASPETASISSIGQSLLLTRGIVLAFGFLCGYLAALVFGKQPLKCGTDNDGGKYTPVHEATPVLYTDKSLEMESEQNADS